MLLLLQAGPIPETSPWASYLKVFGLLAGLLCFCYLILRVLGRRMGGMRERSPGGHLELIDRLGLEPRRSVYVLRAGARYVAIASTESGVQLLLELSPDGLAQPHNPSIDKGQTP